MDRNSATRLALRICILALSIGPAQGQVRVGELIVSPDPDGVTVHLAQDDTATQPPGVLPQQEEPQSVQLPPQQEPARPAITRITLTADDFPPPRWRALPPMPAPRPQLERDVQTLKAARAAMALDDQLRDRKMASLR